MSGLRPDDSEWKTRRRLIEPKLRAAGWRMVKYDSTYPFGKGRSIAIEEFPTENGLADHALCADGRILGVVEAEKLTLGPQNALAQAERYSRGATASRLNLHGVDREGGREGRAATSPLSQLRPALHVLNRDGKGVRNPVDAL